MGLIESIPFAVTVGTSATVTKSSGQIYFRWNFLGASVHFPQGSEDDLKVRIKTNTVDQDSSASIASGTNLLNAAYTPDLYSGDPYILSNNGTSPIRILQNKVISSEANYLHVSVTNSSASVSYTCQVICELIEEEENIELTQIREENQAQQSQILPINISRKAPAGSLG
tara:strand:+ start:449 stop:958 length:510 start_codon:yes stop_codon:yes gene_type:complete